MIAHDNPVGHGKQQAPVNVKALMDNTHAQITLVFAQAAENPTVRLTGTNGLRVTSENAPVLRASYPQGATETLHVTYTPGPNRSYLHVAVSATFNSSDLSMGRVASFALGEFDKSAVRQKQAAERTSAGERVRVTPATPVP